jgi:pyruvate dehydrogenase (quinone)
MEAEAPKVDGPAIVDVVVAADEMPSLPHINLTTAGHSAVGSISRGPDAFGHGQGR